jgi:hypothetical protein
MKMQRFLLALCLLPLGFLSATEPAAKPVVSKTAPRFDQTQLEGPKGNLNPEGAGGVGLLPTPENSRASTDSIKSMSQEIETTSHDEVAIVLEPPPVNLPFRDVVGFSRPGQTETVLTGPVDHLPGNEMLGLAILDMRQAVSPLQFQIPAPPFISMEIPAGYTTSNWSFRVEDQSDQTVYQIGGIRVPRDLVLWDGFKDGTMAVLAGVVYQPVLKLTDARGIPQQFFGDPIQLDVLQYDQGDVRHVEFSNVVLFQRDSADFLLDVAPLVRALLNILRRHSGAPMRIIVHEDERGRPLAEKRVVRLRQFLEDALVFNSENVSVAAESVGPRGSVTEFLITRFSGEGS